MKLTPKKREKKKLFISYVKATMGWRRKKARKSSHEMFAQLNMNKRT
jgi:hypothetical protein